MLGSPTTHLATIQGVITHLLHLLQAILQQATMWLITVLPVTTPQATVPLATTPQATVPLATIPQATVLPATTPQATVLSAQIATIWTATVLPAIMSRLNKY